MKDYSAIAKRYAENVANDEIPACKWIRLACENHLKDLSRQKKKDYPFKFDKDKANKKCEFIELFPHTKGKWAARNQPFILEPWQCFFVSCVFGWVKKSTGLRRYRKAFLFVPRKNGKSDLAARIGLAMFAADGEYGAEVYSGATTEKQAYEVFRPARLMALRTDGFKDAFGIDIFKSNISIGENGSRFEPVIGKPGDGSSPSCAIIDEYHEHDTDEAYDTMETGMGAREQPLMLVITTAGINIAGPCFQLQKQAERVLQGAEQNDEMFALIYTLDKGDEWSDIESIKKANPNYGVSVDSDFLQSRVKDALNNPRKQSIVKTKHCNIWVGAKDAYYNIEDWNACADASLRLEDFEGQRVIIGLDLAHKIDIAALEILIPLDDRRYVRFGKYYLPEETVMMRENEHYRGWLKDGWLTVNEGRTTDFNELKEDILDISERFQLEIVCYDPAQATLLVNQLDNEGIPCVEIKPTVLNFSEPMKELDARMKNLEVLHNGDPVMAWMVSNVTAKMDKKDNVYPNKEQKENKIDGVVAHLMALNRLMADEQLNHDITFDELVIA